MNTIQKMPALDAIKTRARDAVKDLMLETEQLDNAIFVRSLLRGRRIRVLVLFVVLLEESLHVAGHPKSRVAHFACVTEERCAEVDSVSRRNVPSKFRKHFVTNLSPPLVNVKD